MAATPPASGPLFSGRPAVPDRVTWAVDLGTGRSQLDHIRVPSGLRPSADSWVLLPQAGVQCIAECIAQKVEAEHCKGQNHARSDDIPGCSMNVLQSRA